MNVSNPKGLVFFLSLLTPFLNQASPVLPQYAIMGLTCCFTDFVIMNVVAYLAWELSKKLRSARTMRVLNRIFGVIFILIGVGLFFFNV